MAALAVLLAACAAFALREPLSATVADIRPLEVTLLEQRFSVKVRVLNPNDLDIEFDGVVFDLELNGKPFAKGVSSQKGTIPRFGEALIDVNVVSGLSGILRQVNELRSGREAVTYRLSGRVSTSTFGTVPFETKGELRLPGPAGKG
ncbi:MAG: LEA type 2 family protein [Burkholderiales bacterium]|nr:LEA type 2 family protein [Burkholderiales bacterium]